MPIGICQNSSNDPPMCLWFDSYPHIFIWSQFLVRWHRLRLQERQNVILLFSLRQKKDHTARAGCIWVHFLDVCYKVIKPRKQRRGFFLSRQTLNSKFSFIFKTVRRNLVIKYFIYAAHHKLQGLIVNYFRVLTYFLETFPCCRLCVCLLLNLGRKNVDRTIRREILRSSRQKIICFAHTACTKIK